MLFRDAQSSRKKLIEKNLRTVLNNSNRMAQSKNRNIRKHGVSISKMTSKLLGILGALSISAVIFVASAIEAKSRQAAIEAERDVELGRINAITENARARLREIEERRNRGAEERFRQWREQNRYPELVAARNNANPVVNAAQQAVSAARNVVAEARQAQREGIRELDLNDNPVSNIPKLIESNNRFATLEMESGPTNRLTPKQLLIGPSHVFGSVKKVTNYTGTPARIRFNKAANKLGAALNNLRRNMRNHDSACLIWTLKGNIP